MTEANIPGSDTVERIEDGETDIMERRDARAVGVPLFTADWHIFIPTFVILVVYSLAWLYLAITGQSDGALARLFIVVVAMGVPLLAVHAFLRHQTIRLQINDDHLLCNSGWPNDRATKVPFDLIEDLEIKRGLYGLFFQEGTIIIHLKTHNRIAIADLREPGKVKAHVEKAIGEADKRIGA